MCPQSTPSKKGWLFISSTPLFPILFSESIQNLENGNREIIICRLHLKYSALFQTFHLFFCLLKLTLLWEMWGKIEIIYNCTIQIKLLQTVWGYFLPVFYYNFKNMVLIRSFHYFFFHLIYWEHFPKSFNYFSIHLFSKVYTWKHYNFLS